jgi:hypothetical protein
MLSSNQIRVLEGLKKIDLSSVIPVVHQGIEIEKLNQCVNPDEIKDNRIRETKILLNLLYTWKLGL